MAHRSIPQVLHLAHEVHRLPYQAGEVGLHRGVEVRPGTWGRPLLQEIGPKVS